MGVHALEVARFEIGHVVVLEVANFEDGEQEFEFAKVQLLGAELFIFVESSKCGESTLVLFILNAGDTNEGSLSTDSN